MAKMLKRIPRVMVVQETSVQPGRDKLRGIFDYVHLYGPWHVHLVQGRAGEPRPTSAAELKEYDGLLVGQMMLDMEDALKRTRQPLVLMDPLDDALRPGSPFARHSCTLDDSERVSEAAAAYYLARGHQRFAYVGEALNRNWSVRRGDCFCRRIGEAGLPCHLYPVPDVAGDWKEEERHLARWLTALPKPVALLAAMDTRAHQVLDLCVDAGLRVPQEVAVLGIDNDELICNGSVPTLSSIWRDTESCGFLAARMLDRLMRRETRRREVVRYGVRAVVTRDSTRADAAMADGIAQRAREFIRINAGADIGVPDVVRHLNVSRRHAEVRFRAACGLSLLEEIQNVRLERVERLLAGTGLPLAEIGARCGFSTDVHLRRVFKRRFGVSMRDYRKMGKVRLVLPPGRV